MKKIIIPILIVITSFLLVSCGNQDEMVGEIVHYYNEEWMPINDMKEKAMRGIPFELTRLEEKHKEDKAAVLVEDEILPIINRALDRLEGVDTDNKKVKKMNDLQIEAEEFLKEISKDIIVYYKGGDVSEQNIKEYHEELKGKYDKVLNYRDKLMYQYNLEQANNKDSKFYKLKRKEN
ncbi:hypothetical protein ACUL41_15215 [Virgibacillus natechei]